MERSAITEVYANNSNTRGTIAMNRLISGEHTSEWFINVSNNSDTLNENRPGGPATLDGGYTPFGEIMVVLDIDY